MNNEIPNSKTCGGCVHCLAGPSTQNDVLSRSCYRHPPTAVGVLTPQGIALVHVRPEIRTVTPSCGEYEEPDDAEHMFSGLTD